MFWRKARTRYGHLTAADPDIRRYLAVSATLQDGGYSGLVGRVQDLGHRWVAGRTPPGPVLEIGFGRGRHSRFFSGRREDYYVCDSGPQHLNSDAWRGLSGRGICCDAARLPFRDSLFDAVISIYNLEHIADLDGVLREVHRVLRPAGRFLIALPCEGGLLWNLGRELTTRRRFQKTFGINYDKAIAFEHVWDFPGVFAALQRSLLFRIRGHRLLPFGLPTHHLNVIACIECVRGPSNHERRPPAGPNPHGG